LPAKAERGKVQLKKKHFESDNPFLNT